MTDEVMVREYLADNGDVWLIAPKITHNPWHTAYELTPEGEKRITNELASSWLQSAIERHPATSIAVVVGDELICGYCPA